MKQTLVGVSICTVSLALALGMGCGGGNDDGGTGPGTTLEIEPGIWTGSVTVISPSCATLASFVDSLITQELFGTNGLDLCNTTQLEISDQVPVEGCDITVNGNQASMDCDGVFDLSEVLGYNCQVGFVGSGSASVNEAGNRFTIAISGDVSFQGQCLGLEGSTCENTSLSIVGMVDPGRPCPNAGQSVPFPLRAILNRAFHGAP